MAVKGAKTTTLDFEEPVIKQLIFTDSKEEADKLVSKGYAIYFPSELTKELKCNGTIYVVGNYQNKQMSDNEVRVQSQSNAEYINQAVWSSIHDICQELRRVKRGKYHGIF